EPQQQVSHDPTTQLHMRRRARVDALLAGLEQQLLLVTHDLEVAARADRVLVVDEGRVVFDGDPAAGVAVYRQLMEEPAGRVASNDRDRDHAPRDHR
ncbi:MAG: ABC transporter ATP-binding protein, partial [Cellulomonadaceae bacterium]